VFPEIILEEEVPAMEKGSFGSDGTKPGWKLPSQKPSQMQQPSLKRMCLSLFQDCK
jgi:hypothetical protein